MAKLLSRDFLLVTAAAGFFFLSFGATIPVLPRYVAGELGGSDAMVGIVAGSFAVSAIVLRPLVGRIGDSHGRRYLIIGGALITAIGSAAHVPAETIGSLIGARLLIGAGQGAFFVGAATLVSDLAPPERRGEAASYFSVALYLGLGFGPFIGESLLSRGSFDAVWLAATAGMVVAALCAAPLPRGLPPPTPGAPPAAVRRGLARVLHPAGVGPGLVLFLGVIGFIGFNTFVPLHGEVIGLSDVAGVFLLYSLVVLAVRTLGSRLPDALGPVVSSTVALSAIAAGLVGIALWQAPVGLYSFTVVLALGSSLLYPALMAAAVNSAAESERSSVVATFTVFFEVGSAVGGAILGAVASMSSYGGAFMVAAGFSCVALVVLHVYLSPRLSDARAVPGTGSIHA